uniref:p40 n=1 Tax=Indian peanut clump virus L TaxID=119102 RepID=Q9IZ92_9VIRU|nr:P40 [Indian peanut clump virus L]
MDTTFVNTEDVFVAVSPSESAYVGHIHVYRLSTLDKSCYDGSEFVRLLSDFVFVTGVPKTTKRKLQVVGCPLLEGDALTKLYSRLLNYREITNMHGQVMIRLDKPLQDSNGKILSSYVKSVDVFAWSEYGGCDDYHIWSRFVFCTERLVDEPQKLIEGKESADVKVLKDEIEVLKKQLAACQSPTSTQTPIAPSSETAELTALKNELAECRLKLSACESNLLTVQGLTVDDYKQKWLDLAEKFGAYKEQKDEEIRKLQLNVQEADRKQFIAVQAAIKKEIVAAERAHGKIIEQIRWIKLNATAAKENIFEIKAGRRPLWDTNGVSSLELIEGTADKIMRAGRWWNMPASFVYMP